MKTTAEFVVPTGIYLENNMDNIPQDLRRTAEREIRWLDKGWTVKKWMLYGPK